MRISDTMEGIKRRLEFNNHLFQIQSVHALQKLVVGKLKGLSAVGFQTTQEVSELDFLLKLCCHDNKVIAATAKQCMLSLIVGGLVNLENCVQQVLLLVTSTHVPSLLAFLTDLMHIQIGERQLPDRERFVHPLVKVYERAPVDTWQLIAVEFGNSLAAVNQEEMSTRAALWKRILDYHKTFIVALLANSTTKDGLLTSIFFTCLSYTDYLDYTAGFLTKILMSSKDMRSEWNVLLLEMIWQQSNIASRCLSDSNRHLLTKFSLAVMAGGVRSHKLWSQLTSAILAQEGSGRYQNLLAIAIKNNLNSDSTVLANILSIVKKSIEQDKSMESSILFVPLLELLSSLSICHHDSYLLKEAEQCIRHIDNYATSHISVPCGDATRMAEEGYITQLDDPQLLSGSSLNDVLADCEASLTYLNSLDTQIADSGIVSQLSVYTCGAMLLSALSTRVQLAALNTVQSLVISQPTQAPGLFLLVVHWMKRSLHPHVMMAALKILPYFATHKFNLPAVMKYLTGLADASQTRALALRLICDVTSVQSKAFPYLVQALDNYRHDTRQQMMVAKAKTIHHICEHRPTLYTTEILPDLNNILSTHQTQLDTVVSLAINSLEILVEAEVLDIVSAWEVISGHLQGVTGSNRPLIVSSMCEFLAVSASLDDSTYCEFQLMAQSTLWSYTRESSELVVSAAYKSLAQFPYDSIKYSHLPHTISDVYAADYADNKEKYDRELIQAAAVVDLLDSVPSAALDGYQVFLNSLVVNQVSSLGVGQTRSQAAVRPVNVPKSVQKIPGYISHFCDEVKVNKPGTVLANLTVGMLFCQPTTKMKENPTNTEARQMFTASQRKTNQLAKFVQEATPLSLSCDWLFAQQLVEGWTAYINHVLLTVIEGRKADIKISNQSTSQRESELIVRAKGLVEQVIDRSAKHDSTSRCNALIALSCLVRCTRTLLAECGIEENMSPTAYTAYVNWESNVLNGLIAVVKGPLDRAKALLPEFKFKAAEQALSYNVGVVCLSILPYSVYRSNSNLLHTVLTHLHESLKKESAGKSSDDGFYSGQVLSSILADLLIHRHQDICSDEMVSITENSISFLFEHCYGTNSIEGCVLGFTQLAPALLSADTHHVEMVQQAFNKLTIDTSTSVSWYARAVLAAHLYINNRLEREVDEEINAILEQEWTRELACGAGILISTLSQEYHPKSEEWSEMLENSLLLLKESTGDDVRCTNNDIYLRGMLHLTGMLNYQVGGEQLSRADHTLCDKLAEALQTTTDKPQQYSWISGSLYYLISSLNTNSHSRGNPQSYKNSLPTTSVLRYVVERLHSHTRRRHSSTADQLLVLVRCVLAGAQRKQLPLLHWPSLLTPLMRLTDVKGEEIQVTCLRIAISQSRACSLSAAFISKYCLPQLYNNLSVKSRSWMFTKLDDFIDLVENTRLCELRDRVWLQIINQDGVDENESLRILLKSMYKIIEKATNHSCSVVTFIYETLRLFSCELKSDTAHYMSAIDDISSCVLQCESTLSDELLSNMADHVTKLHLSCRLVGRKCTMTVVVSLIEHLAVKCDRQWLLRSVAPCWKLLDDSQALDTMVKMQTAISSSADPQYVGLWLDVLTTAVICWTRGRQRFTQLNTLLPFYISELMSDKPWDQLSAQTHAWLDSLNKNSITAEWFKDIL